MWPRKRRPPCTASGPDLVARLGSLSARIQDLSPGGRMKGDHGTPKERSSTLLLPKGEGRDEGKRDSGSPTTAANSRRLSLILMPVPGLYAGCSTFGFEI